METAGRKRIVEVVEHDNCELRKCIVRCPECGGRVGRFARECPRCGTAFALEVEFVGES